MVCHLGFEGPEDRLGKHPSELGGGQVTHYKLQCLYCLPIFSVQPTEIGGSQVYIVIPNTVRHRL